MLKSLFFSITCLAITNFSFAQVYSNKVIKEEKRDTVLSEYPYFMPFLGKKAHATGIDLPYSAGIGVNYYQQNSNIVIDNLFVGFNNQQAYNLDEVVRFNNSTSRSYSINVRPDLWVLPFLNVYGIIAYSNLHTDVNFSVWVPRNDVWEEVIAVETAVQFNAMTAGFGLTPTFGAGGFWVAADMNFSWTDVDALEKPAFVFNFGPRFGKSFQFKKNRERNFNLWVGGSRIHLNANTSGSLPFNEFINTDGINQRLANGEQVVIDAQEATDLWWNNLTPVQMANPVNVAKHEAAIRATDAAGKFIHGLSSAVEQVDNSTVQYEMQKRQEHKWNFLIGSQFQLNKHWMLRAEVGFLASRNHLIAGLQYRFGL